jgi:DNA-binding transcriptional LysR family regulator
MSKAAPIGKPVESKNLELSLLRTFLALVQHGSMGKTAAAARVTQPAVSAQVLRLENIVGRRLFVRNRNGAKLTAHGELLITYANRAVALNEEALARLRGETMRQRVTLGMSTEVAMIGFATAMKQFRSLHQDVELRVVVTAPNQLDTLLKAGRLDLAIGDPALMTKGPAARWLVPLEWATGRDFEMINTTTLPLVLFENPCSWQDEMLNSLRRAGWEWQVTFESASLDAILAATQSGLGMAALPAEAIRNCHLIRPQTIHLPAPPRIPFGLFRASTLPSEARTLLEIALDSMFRSRTEALAAPAAA